MTIKGVTLTSYKKLVIALYFYRTVVFLNVLQESLLLVHVCTKLYRYIVDYVYRSTDKMCNLDNQYIYYNTTLAVAHRLFLTLSVRPEITINRCSETPLFICITLNGYFIHY